MYKLGQKTGESEDAPSSGMGAHAMFAGGVLAAGVVGQVALKIMERSGGKASNMFKRKKKGDAPVLTKDEFESELEKVLSKHL